MNMVKANNCCENIKIYLTNKKHSKLLYTFLFIHIFYFPFTSLFLSLSHFSLFCHNIFFLFALFCYTFMLLFKQICTAFPWKTLKFYSQYIIFCSLFIFFFHSTQKIKKTEEKLCHCARM